MRSWRDGSLRIPARVFVVVYAFLLFCIPSQLIVRPLGAPGTPANLWGILALAVVGCWPRSAGATRSAG